MGYQPEAVLLAYTQINPDLDTTRFPLHETEDLIEYAGRWDYGTRSLAKMGDRDIIARWIKAGEESMVEMGHAIFFITCSRVVSHEIVRHRLASFQQESQRYVRYDEESVESLFYEEPALGDYDNRAEFDRAVAVALTSYNFLISQGVKPQIARYVLPNATRVRMIMGANFREWRHILKLRMHKSAQPEMRIVTNQIHDQLLAKFETSFKDIRPAIEAGERATR